MKDVSVAIRGGGTRSAIEIGALKAIEEYGINITSISGASVGSIVAVLYASSCDIEEILDKFIRYVKEFSTFDYKLTSILKLGLSSSEVIEKAFDIECKGIRFKDLRIPCEISAFDIFRMKTTYINNHNFPDITVGKACRASSSFPFIFSLHKTKYNSKSYLFIDGGTFENPPINDIIDNTKIVVSYKTRWYDAILYGRSKKSEKRANILVKPEANGLGVLGGPDEIKRAYEIGYKETLKQLEIARANVII